MQEPNNDAPVKYGSEVRNRDRYGEGAHPRSAVETQARRNADQAGFAKADGEIPVEIIKQHRGEKK
jgi:hypothetical protein